MVHRSLFQLTRSLTIRDRQQKSIHLAIALVPMIGSFVLNWGLKIPFLDCPLLRYVGIPCPGWGMTRSFMAIARGDWQQAMAFHGLGIILFVGFAIVSLHLGVELIFRRQLWVFYGKICKSKAFQVFSLSLLMIYHGNRLLSLWQTGYLRQTIAHAPLGHWLSLYF